MPIKLPDLDDHTYADLMAEAMAAIPKLYPKWTDHNASDPGIALIELFAWMTEMVLYRTNQVPDRTYDVFLKLLNGANWSRDPRQSLDSAIQATLTEIGKPFRAVTAQDYEHLALTEDPGKLFINRVRCLPNRNERFESAAGHVTLMVVPSSPADTSKFGELRDFFADRKLLTTRLHVVEPVYVNIEISASVYLKDDADVALFNDPLMFAHNAIFRAFDRRHDSDRPGWPFGRDVHRSDIFSILEGVRGVDRVTDVEMSMSDSALQTRRLVTVGDGLITALQLEAHELPNIAKVTLTIFERRGNVWQPITK